MTPNSRPSPRQLLIRWAVLLLIVVTLSTLTFLGVRAVVTAFSERFAAVASSSSASQSALPSQSESRSELKACPDSAIGISIEVEDGPDFELGDSPTVRAEITNTSGKSCLRDVGSQANEVYVVNADGYRVWSSDRCPVKQSARLVELAPGARYQVTVIWPGTRNPRKCGELARAVAPGEFSVFVSNGSAVSEPTVLTLN